jgi:small basic protein
MNRLKRLFEKMLSLSFITWLLIYITVMYNKQPLDLNFYIFTTAVIGLKIWDNLKQGATNGK